jgi:hypothetical protein
VGGGETQPQDDLKSTVQSPLVVAGVHEVGPHRWVSVCPNASCVRYAHTVSLLGKHTCSVVPSCKVTLVRAWSRSQKGCGWLEAGARQTASQGWLQAARRVPAPPFPSFSHTSPI